MHENSDFEGPSNLLEYMILPLVALLENIGTTTTSAANVKGGLAALDKIFTFITIPFLGPLLEAFDSSGSSGSSDFSAPSAPRSSSGPRKSPGPRSSSQ